MRLTAIRVARFRRLADPMSVDELDPGLTVIAGDNEAGKSTLLEAIRTGLFDKYSLSGQAADALQPLGQKVAPRVEIGFRLDDGGAWWLEKQFCQKAYARLQGPGAVFEGDEAEEALQRLLGFERPGRGPTKPEHQGLWGLLWVQQGTTFVAPPMSELARRSLGGVLESEVGDVLGGGIGQRLLDTLAAERDRYWTKTGRPTGDYRAARERLDEVDAALAEAREALTRYEADVAELERVEARLAGYHEGGRLAELQSRRSAAAAEKQRLDTLRKQLDKAGGDARVAIAEALTVEGRWRERQQLQRQRAEANERRQSLESALAELETRLGGAREREARCRQERSAAETQWRQATAHRQALERRESRAARLTERHRLGDRLEKARAADDKARAARQAVAAIAVDRKGLEALRKLDSELASARARLAAGATRLEVDVTVPHQLTGSGESDDCGYLVTGEATLALEGVGRITVRPGGESLEASSETVDRLQRQLDDRLTPLGVDDVQTAERQVLDRERHDAERKEAEALRDAHAPEGVEDLRRRLEALDADIRALPDEGPAPDSGELEAAREAEAAASRRHEAADRALEAARATTAADREQAATRRAECDAATAQRDRLDEQLAEARGSESDDVLFARLEEHRQRRDAAERARSEAEQAVNALDPETVELALETAGNAVNRAQEDIAGLESQRRDLHVRLEIQGQRGLSEAADALAADREAAQRRHDAVEREANAVRLAWEALDAAAREARETFLGPVMERLQPYLRMLMPGAELVLDDGLRLTAVRRGGVEETFEQLSVGTREQLAIITRLAFADLLAERGEAVPVILDDALVYADEGRFEGMKLVLARAARRHQILLLTCRPGEYLSLGAPVRRLEDAATGRADVS